MAPALPVQYVLNDGEYDLLRKYIIKAAGKEPGEQVATSAVRHHDRNAAAFRSASRVFLMTFGTLKTLDMASARLLARQGAASTPPPPLRLLASKKKLALSFSSLLFFHQVLFRFFTRIRSQLLHEKVRSIRERYPKLYAMLTCRLAPAIGASLSGFALGIFPADQLRVTIVLCVACRALELAYAAIEGAGLIKKRPWWFGSWLLFPLAQGQLFHALVFDRDCIPEAYGSFILNHTPEYIQRRPINLSSKVTWPTSHQIVDALAQMARLRWPPFVSPILHPADLHPLPRTIDPVISPITSRAHPAHQHLSCALIHPSELSCFVAYLRQNLLAFPRLARLFAIYYGALSLPRYKAFVQSPIASLNQLSQQVLRTALAISGIIGTSWGSICLFAAILPRSFLPRFRFFLGGLLGGAFQFLDRTPAGHANALYAARTSVDSLWKVGVKHRWWKGIKGGDVWLFVAALTIVNVVFDLGKDTAVGRDRAMMLIRVLRGEFELGLPQKVQTARDVKEE